MNLSDIISRHALTHPDAPAVVEQQRRWSYREFDAAIDRASAGFLKQGIAPGDVVGVTLPDDALHLVTGYALARIGAVQLPLARHESRVVRDALAKRFGAKLTVGGEVLPDPGWLESGARAEPFARARGGEMPWKIAMTSGTTAAPKAVAQAHATHIAWREINQAAIPLQRDERYLAVVEFGFFTGFRLCMDVHWAGGSVVLDGAHEEVEELLEAIERLSITYLYLVPVHLRQIEAALREDRPRLPALRRLRTGSMVVAEDLRARILRRLTPNLLVAYGTNDAGTPFTLATGDTLARYPDSIGFPVQGVEVQVADDDGQPLPAGKTGQIRVRGPAMPEAYIDNPEASARAFRSGWYYPGDLGMLSAEGALYFKGRADDLMNFDGIKIYPAEIEAALHSHPDVVEAAAFALPSKTHQSIPTAAVVTRGNVQAADLRRWCQEKLGTHAPRSMALLRALPRTPAGKIDKPSLVRLVQEGLEHGREL